MTKFYTPTGIPIANSRGRSVQVRDEYALIEDAFDNVELLKLDDNGGTGTNLTLTGTTTITGTVTAPTPVAGDSSTKVATTAFVTATSLTTVLPGQTGNGGKFITTDGSNADWDWIRTEVLTKSADYTIVEADSNHTINCTAALTLTPPSAVTVGNGWWCYVRNSGTGLVTVGSVGVVGAGDIGLLVSDGSTLSLTSFNNTAVAEFSYDSTSISIPAQNGLYHAYAPSITLPTVTGLSSLSVKYVGPDANVANFYTVNGYRIAEAGSAHGSVDCVDFSAPDGYWFASAGTHHFKQIGSALAGMGTITSVVMESATVAIIGYYSGTTPYVVAVNIATGSFGTPVALSAVTGLNMVQVLAITASGYLVCASGSTSTSQALCVTVSGTTITAGGSSTSFTINGSAHRAIVLSYTAGNLTNIQLLLYSTSNGYAASAYINPWGTISVGTAAAVTGGTINHVVKASDNYAMAILVETNALNAVMINANITTMSMGTPASATSAISGAAGVCVLGSTAIVGGANAAGTATSFRAIVIPTNFTTLTWGTAATTTNLITASGGVKNVVSFPYPSSVSTYAGRPVAYSSTQFFMHDGVTYVGGSLSGTTITLATETTGKASFATCYSPAGAWQYSSTTGSGTLTMSGASISLSQLASGNLDIGAYPAKTSGLFGAGVKYSSTWIPQTVASVIQLDATTAISTAYTSGSATVVGLF